MAAAARAKEEERRRLIAYIEEWNQSRLDLFALSLPNEDLEFYGAMRFYHQDKGEKVSTKCVRVSSTATTKDVMAILIEKFRPDMRMLSSRSHYALYELHVNGEERQLADNERPLMVQLNWGKDDREGRFLLKKESDKTRLSALNANDTNETLGATDDSNPGFKRKLSKREKKEQKKKEKEVKLKGVEGKENDSGVAEKLYNELPESNFTRSISNPELVMRKRRELKLEKKLMQISDGGPEAGGTLKIYGDSVNPDVPYKTLLLSATDNVAHVVKETLDKYGLAREDPEKFCLVQVMIPQDAPDYGREPKERVLEDEECPLSILLQHPPSKDQEGNEERKIMFQLRAREIPKKNKNKLPIAMLAHEPRAAVVVTSFDRIQPDQLPYFVEIGFDGKEAHNARKYPLALNTTEVGRERSVHPNAQYIQLASSDVFAQHCIVSHSHGIVTVTPMTRDALVLVNGKRVADTTVLHHGVVVQFGKAHVFRFLEAPADTGEYKHHQQQQSQPQQRRGTAPAAEVSQRRVVAPRGPPSSSDVRSDDLETTFDLDGHVETTGPGAGLGLATDPRGGRQASQAAGTSVPDSRYGSPGYEPDLLPASLLYKDELEDALLSRLTLEVNGASIQFKLAPTYVLYLALRSRAASNRPDVPANEHARRVTLLTNKMARLVQQAIGEGGGDPGSLSFWMANASELLHFIKSDVDAAQPSGAAQQALARSVQHAFTLLVDSLQGELALSMPAFLAPGVEELEPIDESNGAYRGPPRLSDVLQFLSSAMTLLRRCRVNAALTIQLFSQLFHFVNHWLLNRLLLPQPPHPTQQQERLCTRDWGRRIRGRLGHVEAWAEKQGLELAADCHLAKILQTVYLLESPKTPQDLPHLLTVCDALNSLQLRAALCTAYAPSPSEPPLRPDVVERLIGNAAATVDMAARAEGREVRVEEPPDLQLPFLLPVDGYSCDFVKGMPAGLAEFIDPAAQAGLCRLTINPNSRGVWTVYMSGQENLKAAAVAPSSSSDGKGSDTSSVHRRGEPDVLFITFSKVKNSLGLSIVAAKGEGNREKCIYVKSVVPGGGAAMDGRLQAGDQLVEVDGHSLVGVTQEKAAEMMTRTGPVVNLKVAKQGALYHGLAMLLDQTSNNNRGTGSPAKPPVPGGPATPSAQSQPDAKLRPKSEDVSRFNQPPQLSLAHQPAAQQPGSQPALQQGWGGAGGPAGGGQRALVQQHEAKSTPILPGARDVDPYRPPNMASPPGTHQHPSGGVMGPPHDSPLSSSSSQPELHRQRFGGPGPPQYAPVPLPGLVAEGGGGPYGKMTAQSTPNIGGPYGRDLEPQAAPREPPGGAREPPGGARPRSEEPERQKVLDWQQRNQQMQQGTPRGPAIGAGVKPMGSAAQALFPTGSQPQPVGSKPAQPGIYPLASMEVVNAPAGGRDTTPRGGYEGTENSAGGYPPVEGGYGDQRSQSQFMRGEYKLAMGREQQYAPYAQQQEQGGYRQPPADEGAYRPPPPGGVKPNDPYGYRPSLPYQSEQEYTAHKQPQGYGGASGPSPAGQGGYGGRVQGSGHPGGHDGAVQDYRISSQAPLGPAEAQDYRSGPPQDLHTGGYGTRPPGGPYGDSEFPPPPPPSQLAQYSAARPGAVSLSPTLPLPPAEAFIGPPPPQHGPPPPQHGHPPTQQQSAPFSSSLEQRAQPAFPDQERAVASWPATGPGPQTGPGASGQLGPAARPPGAKRPPPPISAKPKLIPIDPVIANQGATGGGAGWGGNSEAGAGRHEDGEGARRRADEIRRLETRPYLSGEEQGRLKRLRAEAEFETRANQALREGDSDAPSRLVFQRAPASGDPVRQDSRLQEQPEPTYAKIDRSWNQAQPPRIPNVTNQPPVQSQFARPPPPNNAPPSGPYSDTRGPNGALKYPRNYPPYGGEMEYQSVPSKFEEKSNDGVGGPPPLPSMPPPEEGFGARGQVGSENSRGVGSGSALRAGDASLSLGGPVTKKSVTFNENIATQYNIVRSYGSTSSESSFPQSPEQGGGGYFPRGGGQAGGEGNNEGEGQQYEGYQKPYMQQQQAYRDTNEPYQPQPYQQQQQGALHNRLPQQYQQQPYSNQQRDEANAGYASAGSRFPSGPAGDREPDPQYRYAAPQAKPYRPTAGGGDTYQGQWE